MIYSLTDFFSSNHFVQIVSMGQGQEELARQLISDAVVAGSWLLLQNCHLCLPFCGEIMDYVGEACSINPDFRMWLTTDSHKEFPIGLLHAAIKYTNEAPQGIKASMRRTYQAVNQVHFIWMERKFALLDVWT
jgi:dynein heavy chain